MSEAHAIGTLIAVVAVVNCAVGAPGALWAGYRRAARRRRGRR